MTILMLVVTVAFYYIGRRFEVAHAKAKDRQAARSAPATRTGK